METSYKVRIWGIEPLASGRYRVRWLVDGEKHGEVFEVKTAADSFRSDLVSARGRGEAFDRTTGLPRSMKRDRKAMDWYSLACDYVDAKWDDAAATTRRSISEALTTVTVAMLKTERGKPDPKLLRRALRQWAFSKSRRDSSMPVDVEKAIQWVAAHTNEVSVLADDDTLKTVLVTLKKNLNGKDSKPNYFNRRRAVFYNSLEYAVSLDLLTENPLRHTKRADTDKRTKPTTLAVDRRCVANPHQARRLIQAAGTIRHSGPHLKAFYALAYYAGLRPEEALDLGREHLAEVPREGWGTLNVDGARPEAGRGWTDTGDTRDERHLKHRPVDETRPVPCCPELTTIIWQHVDEFGFAPDGRLFRGHRGGEISSSTYSRIWEKARQEALTPEQVASKLAEDVYALRHACLSTWLNAGIDPTQVAQWAGNSVKVLLAVYAKCLDRSEQFFRRRIEQALDPGANPPEDD